MIRGLGIRAYRFPCTLLFPSLRLNFVGPSTLDPRITFTRSTTATFTGSNGLIQTAAINDPRFDYSPTTLAPLGLLIEEQRTNLLLNSETFATTWTTNNVSVTPNTSVSPDGTTTADTLTGNGATSSKFLDQTSLASALTKTFSVFVKAGTNNFVQLNFATDGTPWANFALTNGTVGSTGSNQTASIADCGNGWYRCIITTSSTTATNVRICLVSSATAGRAETNSLSTSVLIWGAQQEAGAFPTSYIPTVASQVTRAADNAVMTGTNFSSWYNAVEGTLFVNYSAFASGTRTMAAINDNTANESILLRTISTNPFLTVTDGGVDQADIDAGTVASNIVYKFAGAYAANNFAASIAGGAAVTDTSGSIPTVDRMMIGNSSASNALNGCIQQIVYYPRRLSNAELQALTTDAPSYLLLEDGDFLLQEDNGKIVLE